MTTEQINKAIRYALEYKMGWRQLATKLMHDPFNLTAVDATRVLDEYKRQHPKMAALLAHPLPPFKAPDTVQLDTAYPIEGAHTGRLTGRQNIQPTKPRKKHEHTPSALVRAATKEFALAVSGKKKNGKFRRVGKKFIQTIETDLENIVRDIGVRNKHSEDDIPGDWDFVNHLRIWPKLAEQLNRAIRRRIFERVMSQPSIGKTLK